MRVRPYLIALVVAVLAGAGLLSPARASTGGTADGSLHPNVALILAYSDDGNRYRCSATLIRAD
ncbi:MAG: pterin-4-alpha-carbinolamine dehydratase, partial [Ktedonobacteraceae bacterium]